MPRRNVVSNAIRDRHQDIASEPRLPQRLARRSSREIRGDDEEEHRQPDRRVIQAAAANSSAATKYFQPVRRSSSGISAANGGAT